jgi:ubiquinone/menaquinone biosynthesis C-methylase UbiE
VSTSDVTDYQSQHGAIHYAQHADASPYNAGYERPAIREILGDVQGLRVLDAGCAAGGNLAWLVDQGAHPVGVDLSVPLLRLARGRVQEAPVACADFTHLPFADHSFDVVFSSLALHYVADWQHPLNEFSRVLAPGGRLVLSVHHPMWDWPQHDPSDYFSTGWIEQNWSLTGGHELAVRYHRKTLGEVISAVAATFRIRAVSEPQPQDWVREQFPDTHARLSRTPTFLFIDAVSD